MCNLFSLFNKRAFIYSIFVAFWAVLFAPSIQLYAQELELTAEVDKNKLTLEDSIYLKIIALGSQNSPAPQLPPLPDFRVRSGGTSSSTQIINGNISASSAHTFILTPKKAGEFIIGPATLSKDGKTYKTEPIKVTVSEPSRESREESLAYVEASLSNKNPYVGEQLIYTFKFYRKTGVQNLNLDTPYDQLKFRKDSLGKTRNYEQNINGVIWKVLELPIAYFPTQEGSTEIPPAILEMDILVRSSRPSRQSPLDEIFDNPFFRSRRQIQHKILRTRNFKVSVKPLPKSTVPLENFSGLAGQFQLSAELGKSELETGDTTTLTIAITGTGNIEEANIGLKGVSENFKVYSDQPVFEKTIQDQKLGGKKTFKFALVPLKPGKLLIPPISLSYFDPEKERYETIRTQALYISSIKSQDEEKIEKDSVKDFSNQTDSIKKNIKILGEDIFPIHIHLEDFTNKKISGQDKILYLAFIIFPIVLFVLASRHSNFLRRSNADPKFFKSRQAYKIVQQRMDNLGTITEPKLFVAELSHLLKEYIGNKFQFTGASLTSKEAEILLNETNLGNEIRKSAFQLLEKLETLQYSSATDISRDDLLEESRHLLGVMEKRK